VKKKTKRKPQAKTKPASTAIVKAQPLTVSEAIEKVLLTGDLAVLSVDDRLKYYNTVCKAIGVNPLTRPLEYIVLNGKMTLYARKDCTEQLRRIYNVGVIESKRETVGDLHIVTVKVQDRAGKTDIATGAVSVKGLSSTDLANAIMKAETKAKRRATLSICGLGFLDESEVEDIDQYGMVTHGGRVMYEEGKEPKFHNGKAQAQIEAEVERQKTGAEPSALSDMRRTPPESVPGAAWKRETEKKADMPPKAIIPNTPIEVQPVKGAIEVDYTDDPNQPYIRGNVAEVAAHFPKDLVLRRKNDFWCAFAEDVKRIKMICDTQGFKITEIRPKQVSPAPKKPEKATAVGRSGEGAGTPAAPAVVSGTIEEIFAPPNTKSPMRQVKILMADGKKPTFGCFKQDLFSELDKAKGAIEVYVTKTVKGDKSFFNIVGLKKLGSKEWLEDGTPVVQQKDREAGGKTLF
jgi:hypothetical protein